MRDKIRFAFPLWKLLRKLPKWVRLKLMNNSLNVINERVDDLPLLLTQLRQMGVSEQLDKHFSTHGNWQGLSLGSVAIVWLSYILSQGDHY